MKLFYEQKKEAAQRHPIEGKFGQGKNGYYLHKISVKSESWRTRSSF
jgi:hypothetical protein